MNPFLRNMTIFHGVLFVLALPLITYAGGHHAVRQQVVYPQVYYGVPQISYFVGQEVRVEALVQKALREDKDWQAFQQFKQWQAQQQAAPQPVESPRLPMLSAKCASCHSGDTPKGGLLLDGTAAIDAGYFTTAARLMKSGKMPKGKPALSDAERNAIQDELLSLIQVTDPVPEPPTEKTP